MDKDDFKNALRFLVIVAITIIFVLAVAVFVKNLTETPTKQTETSL